MAELKNINGVTGENGELKSMTAMVVDDNGETQTITAYANNPRFNEVKRLLDEYQEATAAFDFNNASELTGKLADAFLHVNDLAGQVSAKFEKINGFEGRLTRKGNKIFMDYEPIDPVLEKECIKALDSGDEKVWSGLANFIKRLYSNTASYVREQLFTWLEATFQDDGTHGFSILPDGRFVGYKGCGVDENGVAISNRVGFAIVDGVEHNGHIPNAVGSVVEMPRGMVQDDPAVGCSRGLHVGTWGYASGFAEGRILTVAVAPEDVVSIPVDCDAQKLRCCRYEVLEIVDAPMTAIAYNDYDDLEDDDGWGIEDEDYDYVDEDDLEDDDYEE